MDSLLSVKERIDEIYNQVIDSKEDTLKELDILMVKLINHFSKDEIESTLAMSIIDKINLIYDLLEVKKDNLLTLEHLQEEFKILEVQRFLIENNYVMGVLKIQSIEDFRQKLFNFRNMLYAITISDTNILEIAKLKSKIQHFNTEVLEDEDILRQAYENSN